MFKKESVDCPLWKGPCKEHKCRWYTQIIGTHPNTGEDINRWDCAIAWLPALFIENSKIQRETSSEVHELRNDLDDQHKSFVALAMEGHLNGVKLVDRE